MNSNRTEMQSLQLIELWYRLAAADGSELLRLAQDLQNAELNEVIEILGAHGQK